MHSFITKAAVVAALATSMSSGVAAAQQPTTAKHILFYEKNSSLVYTSPSGKVATLPTQSGPAPGSQIEFTDFDYSGTLAHHSSVLGASDHFVCTLSASGNPTCNGVVGAVLEASAASACAPHDVFVPASSWASRNPQAAVDVTRLPPRHSSVAPCFPAMRPQHVGTRRRRRGQLPL